MHKQKTSSVVIRWMSLAVVAMISAPVAACSGTGTSTGTYGGSDGGTTSTSSALCNPEGSWDVQFQWSGLTPGELTIVVTADHAASIPAGPGVTATTGMTKVSGNDLTWSFADGSTFTGTATSSCSAIGAGTMRNTKGTLGKFTADKKGSASSSSSSSGGTKACKGCTADSDCGSCKRCERTTCTCISRLTCK